MLQYSYLKRIFEAYVLKQKSHLSFWHGKPEINDDMDIDYPKAYYMKFYYKAYYDGEYDNKGIPLLDYRGDIGKQYNPIAISQYGLGNYNLYLKENKIRYKESFFKVANWLVDNLEINRFGVYVWHHYFDFEYRDKLLSPWYSGLAQGLGISVLAIAYIESKENKYLEALELAWISMQKKNK